MLRKLSYYGDLLAKLGFGIIFGQTALLNDNPRNASIITLEPCEFMVFHKKALDMIKTFYSKDFVERKNYLLKMIPEMSLINNQLRITQIIEFFKPLKLTHGMTLTQEGQRSNKVYFMQEGEVKIIKKLSLPKVINNRSIEYFDKEMVISTVSGNTIIGEECLEYRGRYNYTTVINSAEAHLLIFERTSNFSDFQSFPLFSILLKGFLTKK